MTRDDSVSTQLESVSLLDFSLSLLRIATPGQPDSTPAGEIERLLLQAHALEHR